MVLRIVRGTAADWELRAVSRTGGPVEGFEAADPITARLWPGGGGATLFNPRVAWTDAPAGKFRVSIDDGQTDNLANGAYSLEVASTRAGRTAALALVHLWIEPAPGAAPPAATYCSAADLALESGWVTSITNLDDPAEAIAQRAAAREWLNGLVLAAWNGGGASSAFPGVPTASGGGGLGADPWFVDLLESRGVLLDGPRGRAVRRCCSYYAAALIARAQPGEQAAKYAAHFLRRANAAAAGLIVDIDADGDGKADLSVALGSVNLRRG